MIPKPVRRLIYIFLTIVVGYYLYTMVSAHTAQEVIVLKQYTKALMAGETMVGRKLSLDPKNLDPFKKRGEALRGDIRFTYYKIKNIRRRGDGKTTNISMQQVFRLNPPGMDSFFGVEEVKNNIQAVLVKPKSAWKIQSYTDNYYTPGMKE